MNIFRDSKKRLALIKKQKDAFLKIAQQSKTPLYLFDKTEIQKNLKTFKNAFRNEGIDINVFYAVKSNYYHGLLKTVVKEGENLDVSSQRELKLALKAGAKQIIYTGPAKTKEDFELILKHHEKINVNLESLRELRLLAEMAEKKKVIMRCGVRIYTRMQNGWTKFGIPMEELATFFREAQKYKSIHFCGIHFHISFNKNPEKYIKTLEMLSEYLQKNFTQTEREEFEYLDIGGGFYPQQWQAIYSWNEDQESAIPEERDYIKEILEDKFLSRTLTVLSQPIEIFAQEISRVLQKKIKNVLPNVSFYAEPGRYISHSCMHFLLNLVDIKTPHIGITDGGNNMVGWELFQFYYYAPIFNLSQFDEEREIPFITYGSLCTPDDIWGYYLYTKKQPKEGDILLIPYQGAYTYTLAQQFIKDVPPVYDLGGKLNIADFVFLCYNTKNKQYFSPWWIALLTINLKKIPSSFIMSEKQKHCWHL
ncbi:alanine racemase [Candidatus Gracilibacteria bacterium]|nr:alanine racemase [Candidatus Gracilibacteria bacterium]